MYLHEATLGLINLDQNRIIKVFSIAAVLFLPPTVVGTIYGMNFEVMPELKWASGYPFALALMLISAVLPYYWFKRRGWLGLRELLVSACDQHAVRRPAPSACAR